MIKRTKKAFTITELVIVIAVIAILAAVLIPTFSSVIENSKKSAALQSCRNCLTALKAEPENATKDLNGTVFVNDGYAYVLYSNGLQEVGELDDLVVYGTDGKLSDADDLVEDDASKAITFTGLNTDTAYNKITFGTIEFAKPTAGAVYIYQIVVNDSVVNGCFSLIQTADYSLEGAYYSIAGVATSAAVAVTAA